MNHLKRFYWAHGNCSGNGEEKKEYFLLCLHHCHKISFTMNAYQQSSVRFYQCLIRFSQFFFHLHFIFPPVFTHVHGNKQCFLFTNNALKIHTSRNFFSSSRGFFIPPPLHFLLSKPMNRNPSKLLKGYSICFLSISISEQQGFLWQKRCKLQSKKQLLNKL